jgi:cell division protein ZapA (FtsZ GTPase activity inhibitor)
VTQKRTVPVKIQGREYRIRADGDATSVHRAAELLDETMSKVRARSGSADTADVAVLAALNLANTLAAGGRVGGAGLEGLEKRISALAQLVESALRDPGAADS